MNTSFSIDIENVTVAYHGKVALHSASLQLKAGTICGLVGMNGAGKSTLFKSVMGFVKPVSGRVLINGLPMRLVQKNNPAYAYTYNTGRKYYTTGQRKFCDHSIKINRIKSIIIK